MPAFIKIELPFNRHPARCPEISVIVQIVIASPCIQRNVVVAVTGNPPQTGVAVERIPSGRVGNQAEKLLVAQVVDPGIRSLGGVDDIFLALIVKFSEFHG
ncbi:hypothetical protein D3C77_472800 [compost metagenome]